MIQGKMSGFNIASRYFNRLSMILVISSLLNLGTINSVMAEPELIRTLTVTGNAKENIPTTIAEVVLGVEIRGKTAASVQEQVAENTSAVVKVLREKNVEQLQTSGVRLNPNYDRMDKANGQVTITGYTGVNTVRFRIPTEQVGDLLDEAIEVGASRVDGVSFMAAPEAIAIAKKAALREASVNAQDQADVVLDTLNLTSKEIIKIEIDEARTNQPKPVLRQQLYASESRQATPIIGGNQTVQASVTLQISY